MDLSTAWELYCCDWTFGIGRFDGDYCASMQRFNRLDCQRFISPAFAQDMNFSGYLNYAKFNYSTMLITDTAHYRNPYYNTEQDTLDKLDLTKMAQVVNGLVDMVIRL